MNPADMVGSDAPANASASATYIDSLAAGEKAMPVPVARGCPPRENAFDMMVSAARGGGRGGGRGPAARGRGRGAGSGSKDNQAACPRCNTLYEKGHLMRDHFRLYDVPDAHGNIEKRRLCKVNDHALIKEGVRLSGLPFADGRAEGGRKKGLL